MNSIARRLVYAGVAAALLSAPTSFVNGHSQRVHAAACDIVAGEDTSQGIDLVLHYDPCDGTVWASAHDMFYTDSNVIDTVRLRDDTAGVEVASKYGNLYQGRELDTGHVIESCYHRYSAHDDLTTEVVSGIPGCGK